MFTIIDGIVTLRSSDGTPISTVSGTNGSAIEVYSPLVDTISEGSVKVLEQNLDSEGYIRNSSHNMGQYDGQWFPFALDSQNRLRLVVESTPTIDSHVYDTSIHFTEASIDKYTTAEVDTKFDEVYSSRTFLNLADTPDTYVPGMYLRTTSSGIVFDTEYLSNVVYIHPTYSGSNSDGSFSHPFTTIPQAALYINNNYTDPNGIVIIKLHPGIYNVEQKITITNPALKAIIGSCKSSTILKPAAGLIGQTFIEVQTPVNTASITFDASDNIGFDTISGTKCIDITEASTKEIFFSNIEIKGFHTGLECHVEANLYLMGTGIRQATNGVVLASGVVFDAEYLYIDSCSNAHLSVSDGAKAYIGESEFSSAYIEGYEGLGTAVSATGEDTVVELFAGTNIWGCNKNISATNNAVVKVDNCVLEETTSPYGIVQSSGAILTIVNSRTPLGSEDTSIAEPTNFYVNSFDSAEHSTTIGNSSQTDQTLFSINTGQSNKPVLRYEAVHNGSYRAISFFNPVSNEDTEFYAAGTDGDTTIGVHPVGPNAASYSAALGLVSIQDGVRTGWNILKEAGDTPDLKFKTKTGVDALTIDYFGNIAFTNGVAVNTISGVGSFDSPNENTLTTTAAIYDFVNTTNYSKSELNSGQLDDRYYTETEVDAFVNTLSGSMLYSDGSAPLSADWDAGDYEIAASGFNVADVELDLSGFTNITGVLTGGIISINVGDATKLDVTSGTGIYVNMDDRINPIVEKISWDNQTIDSGLAGTRSKWIGIERTNPGVGSVVTTGTFSQLQKRKIAILGRYWGQGTSTITGTGKYTAGAFSFGKSMEDIAYAIGSINISGNKFYPTASGSMQLSRTEGEAFRFSANYNNNNISPNIYESPPASGISNYQYHLFDDIVTYTESDLDPDYYDLDGVKTAMASDTWSIQQVYYFPVSNTIHVIYGQAAYNTYNDAFTALSSYTPNLNTDILIGSILRAVIILKQGATDLTDANQAVVIDATVGSFSSNSGGGTGVTNHGNLTGLLDDDHSQYLLANGSRNIASVISYTVHPTFNTDTQIVDKKFVDDALSSLTTDHGSLQGLEDDDHTQYLNNTRGDTRYYTQSQVDAMVTDLDSAISSIEANLPAVQLSTTTYDAVNYYTSVVWTTQNVETDTSVIEWTSGSNITVKETGAYLITYTALDDPNNSTGTFSYKLTKNGSTNLPLSERDHYEWNTNLPLSVSVVTSLNAFDTIQLQMMYTSSSVTYNGLINLYVIRLKGTRGEQGPAGSGSTLAVQQASAYVDNTPHTVLNFSGAGVTVTDAGGGVANVEISGATSLFGTNYQVQTFESYYSVNSFTPSTVGTLYANSLPAGTYRIGWYYEWSRNTASNDYMARIRLDYTTIMEHSQEPKDVDSWHTASGFYVASLTSGNHTISFDHWGETSSYTSFTRRIRLEIWRIS